MTEKVYRKTTIIEKKENNEQKKRNTNQLSSAEMTRWFTALLLLALLAVVSAKAKAKAKKAKVKFTRFVFPPFLNCDEPDVRCDEYVLHKVSSAFQTYFNCLFKRNVSAW